MPLALSSAATADMERPAFIKGLMTGALATAGNVVFYGTLEGYLKAVDAKTGKELYKFKTPSGIIGNVITYEHGGKQYVAVLSGIDAASRQESRQRTSSRTSNRKCTSDATAAACEARQFGLFYGVGAYAFQLVDAFGCSSNEADGEWEQRKPASCKTPIALMQR